MRYPTDDELGWFIFVGVVAFAVTAFFMPSESNHARLEFKFGFSSTAAVKS